MSAIQQAPQATSPRPRRFTIALSVIIALLGIGYAGWKIIPRRPVVVLMDSHQPDVVYCDSTRAQGGSNTDDIEMLLRNLNLVIAKEPTSLDWADDRHVIDSHPPSFSSYPRGITRVLEIPTWAFPSRTRSKEPSSSAESFRGRPNAKHFATS